MIEATLYLRWRGEVDYGRETEALFFTAAESAEVWDRWQRGYNEKGSGPTLGMSSLLSCLTGRTVQD
jgi:hypothetical protein